MKIYRRTLFFTAIFSLLFIPQIPAQEYPQTIVSVPVFIGQEQVFTLKNVRSLPALLLASRPTGGSSKYDWGTVA